MASRKGELTRRFWTCGGGVGKIRAVGSRCPGVWAWNVFGVYRKIPLNMWEQAKGVHLGPVRTGVKEFTWHKEKKQVVVQEPREQL